MKVHEEHALDRVEALVGGASASRLWSRRVRVLRWATGKAATSRG
jgi:hypothetical protein